MTEASASDESKPVDEDGYEPFLTPSGWVHSVVIGHTAGPSYRVLFYEDGTARFEHRCDRGKRGVVVCAPALRLGPHAGEYLLGGHRIERADPLTISPSILCSDCGTHGFVRDGRWVR